MIPDRDPYRCIVSLAVLGHGIVEWFCEINPLTDDGHHSKIISEQVPSKLASVADFTTRIRVTRHARLVPGARARSVDVVQRALEANTADDELSAKVVAYLERQQAGERAAPRQPSIRWATTRWACGLTRSSSRTADGSASSPSGPA